MHISLSLSILVMSIMTALFANVQVANASQWAGAPKAAKKLFRTAAEIPEGKYRLRSGSGKYATFFSQGDDVRMYSLGKGGSDLGRRATIFTIRNHPLRVKGYRAIHSVHVFNRSGNEKCLTAAWGRTANTFSVFDRCRIDLLGKAVKGGKTSITSAHGKIPNDKQMWIFERTGHKNTYRIIAVAHIEDMITRCMYGTHIQGRGAMGFYKGLALDACTNKDSSLFHWTLERVGH